MGRREQCERNEHGKHVWHRYSDSVLEVTVDSVEEAKRRLVKNGCEIIKDEPDFPRCYIKDPFGLIYNLTR